VFDYTLTYLLTPLCIVLLEQRTGLQLVKKFPAFHGTRRFITALTSVCHLSLSWASPIQSKYPHPTSWRSVLIFLHTLSNFHTHSGYDTLPRVTLCYRNFYSSCGKRLEMRNIPYHTWPCERETEGRLQPSRPSNAVYSPATL